MGIRFKNFLALGCGALSFVSFFAYAAIPTREARLAEIRFPLDFYQIQAPDLDQLSRQLPGSSLSNPPFDREVADRLVRRASEVWARCGIGFSLGRFEKVKISTAKELTYSRKAYAKEVDQVRRAMQLPSSQDSTYVHQFASYLSAGDRLSQLIWGRPLGNLNSNRIPVVVIPSGQLVAPDSQPYSFVVATLTPASFLSLSSQARFFKSSKTFMIVYGYNNDPSVARISGQHPLAALFGGDANILGHELGHFFGLFHSENEQDIMYAGKGENRLSQAQCVEARAFIRARN